MEDLIDAIHAIFSEHSPEDARSKVLSLLADLSDDSNLDVNQWLLQNL